MPLSQIHDMNIISHTSTVMRWIVVAKHAQFRTLASCDLGDVGRFGSLCSNRDDCRDNDVDRDDVDGSFDELGRGLVVDVGVDGYCLDELTLLHGCMSSRWVGAKGGFPQ